MRCSIFQFSFLEKYLIKASCGESGEQWWVGFLLVNFSFIVIFVESLWRGKTDGSIWILLLRNSFLLDLCSQFWGTGLMTTNNHNWDWPGPHLRFSSSMRSCHWGKFWVENEIAHVPCFNCFVLLFPRLQFSSPSRFGKVYLNFYCCLSLVWRDT